MYGRNPVREVVRGRREARTIWAIPTVLHEPWIAEASAGGTPINQASGAEIESICGSSEHQGVCAEVEPFPYADASSMLRAPEALIVVLDEIQDPHNLGAVCRVAECAGVTGVVLPERRAAEVTPAVCKASAGAVEHLSIARVTNLVEFLKSAKQGGAWVYGAAAGGTAYDQPDFAGPAVVVLGAEGRGLRPLVAATCDDLVGVPLHGRIDSLNVATAAAVIVFAVVQNRLQGRKPLVDFP